MLIAVSPPQHLYGGYRSEEPKTRLIENRLHPWERRCRYCQAARRIEVVLMVTWSWPGLAPARQWTVSSQPQPWWHWGELTRTLCNGISLCAKILKRMLIAPQCIVGKIYFCLVFKYLCVCVWQIYVLLASCLRIACKLLINCLWSASFLLVCFLYTHITRVQWVSSYVAFQLGSKQHSLLDISPHILI